MELKLPYAVYSPFRAFLLIVPYGIETELQETNKARNSTFNRTLWN